MTKKKQIDIRLMPWMRRAPAHIRDDAAVAEYEAELKALTKQLTEKLRTALPDAPLAQIKASALADAETTLFLRGIASAGKRRHIEYVTSSGGAATRLDLTWKEIESTWQQKFKYYGTARKADEATGRHHSCSGTVQNLRLNADVSPRTTKR